MQGDGSSEDQNSISFDKDLKSEILRIFKKFKEINKVINTLQNMKVEMNKLQRELSEMKKMVGKIKNSLVGFTNRVIATENKIS